MKIKATLIFHLTPVRMIKVNRTTHSKCWRRCGFRGNPPIHCWWDCKLERPLRKSVQRILKKLKVNLLYDQDSLHMLKEFNTRLHRLLLSHCPCRCLHNSQQEMELVSVVQWLSPLPHYRVNGSRITVLQPMKR